MIRYVDGDLVQMAKEGKFDVIAHGCNCFCAMGAGIAPQIKVDVVVTWIWTMMRYVLVSKL